MTLDTQVWCEEKNCSDPATHVVVWADWAARLCQVHAAKGAKPKDKVVVGVHAFEEPDAAPTAG